MAPRTGKSSANSTKTIVYIGAYTAAYFVMFFGIGMLGIFAPWMMFVSWVIALLLGGSILLLLVAKTKAMFTMTSVGVIIGLLMVVTGHTFYTLVGTIGCGFLADLIIKSGKYTNPAKNILGYAVFSMWLCFPLLPIFLNSADYFAYVAEQMKSQEYADAMAQLFTPQVLLAWYAIAFVVALIGGAIGQRLVGRSFRKAGMV